MRYAMNDPRPNLVLANCSHMTEPVLVDGRWRTPTMCDDCIVENASRPLTEEQVEDFAGATEQLLRITKRDFGDTPEVGP